MMTGIDARDAAEKLGSEWTAKSDRYLGTSDGCLLCYMDMVLVRFMSWGQLVEDVNRRLRRAGREEYVKPAAPEITRGPKSFRIPFYTSISEL